MVTQSSSDSVSGMMPSQQSLATAIVQTVAYVDVFDYPLLPTEVHRYLIGMAAPLQAVEKLLSNGHLVPRRLARRDGYVTLPGRQQIVETRQQREEIAYNLWPLALHYGQIIAGMPFVRMVAVTGSLSVNNAEAQADIDYLVVTANDRLWLSRAFIIMIVHLAARRGVHLCPNYLLSERALVLTERNLYTARELAQMVPLSGADIYRQMRGLNQWVDQWLPNASSPPQPFPGLPAERASRRSRLQSLLERGLKSGVGRRLEQWEMQRKLAKFQRQVQPPGTDLPAEEVQFSADWCKGHFDGHARQVLAAYDERVHTWGADS